MSSEIIVRDNLFDLCYLHEFFNKLEEIPLITNNIANRYTWPYGKKGSHRLLGATIFERISLNRVTKLSHMSEMFFDVFEMLEQVIFKKNLLLTRIDVNAQTIGMNGSTHSDGSFPNLYTMLWMVNPEWKKDWGGSFQVLDHNDTVTNEIEYEPGRIIAFPSNLLHRGMAPTIENVVRYSVVFLVVDKDKLNG